MLTAGATRQDKPLQTLTPAPTRSSFPAERQGFGKCRRRRYNPPVEPRAPGRLTQRLECHSYKVEVTGSNPVSPILQQLQCPPYPLDRRTLAFSAQPLMDPDRQVRRPLSESNTGRDGADPRKPFQSPGARPPGFDRTRSASHRPPQAASGRLRPAVRPVLPRCFPQAPPPPPPLLEPA